MYKVHDEETTQKRLEDLLTFAAIGFMASLLVADITSIKLFEERLFGTGLLVPAGTLAFALTFVFTDVVIEVAGRRAGLRLVAISVGFRLLTLLYFVYTLGTQPGPLGWTTPPFWSEADEFSYRFVFGGTVPIYLAGFAAVIVAFINDIYIFSYLRERHRGKNLYWLRNFLSTGMSQIINSTIFITLAFGASLTIPQILAAIGGQCIVKVIIAFVDLPLAYVMRNYAQGRVMWYNIFSADFWKG